MRYLLFLTLLLACVSARGENTKNSETKDSPYEQLEILTRAMQLIRQDYVNESKTSYKELTYSALHGMLESLDPHSQFMEPKDFKSMQEDTKSEFAGLGVTLTEKSGILTILHPMEDTPGFEAGLLPGDQILKINGESTEKLNINSAIEKLRGKVGERVTLTINRPSTSQVKDFEIIRAIIKVPSVKDAQILTLQGKARIGYVRITQFNEPTAMELANALNKLEKDGMEALVLDLRYNPGGLLGSAVDVCGEFLEPNTLIVSTEGRTPSREYRTATTSTSQREYPIVVLTNYASASGSEIVAGALKDLGRALLVGETTFGKGSVQSVVSLPDGSAARLTTAKYFTPSRKLIHEHGVSPHIRATLTHEQETALLRSRRKGEESSTPPRPPADPQLDRAVDALQATILSIKTAQVRPTKK
jgi:carboxyl-terminal processing protease